MPTDGRSLRSPSLQHVQAELEANLTISANGETGEVARVLGSLRERGYTTAGRRDITRSRTQSTVIRNLTEKASLLT